MYKILNIIFNNLAEAVQVFPKGDKKGICVFTYDDKKYELVLQEFESGCVNWVSEKDYPGTYSQVEMALYNQGKRDRKVTLFLLKGTL